MKDEPIARGRVVVRRYRRCTLLLIALMIGTSAAGWVLATETSGLRRTLNLVALGVFAVGAMVLSLTLTEGSVGVEVTSAGITDRTRLWRRAFVPWERLTSITTWAASYGDFMTLQSTRPSGEVVDVTINAGALKGGVDAVKAAIVGHPGYQESPAARATERS